jgi:mono/diheme cytochrome c family protein
MNPRIGDKEPETRAKPARTAATRRPGIGSALVASIVMAAAAATPACKREVNFTEGRKFAGDVEVSAATLNEGHDAYMQYCYACHGEKGDGKGPASYGLRPPPRDFTKAIFKFARLRSSDEMPNDDDLVRIVKGGLHGTAMLPWDITPEQLNSIIQYIKTFGPLTEDGRQEHTGSKWEKRNKKGNLLKILDVWEPEADPWAGKDQEAIQRGKELYHLRAECVNCHPGYDTKESLYKMSVEASKREPNTFSPLKGFRDDLYHSQAKKSEEYGVQIMPPDFTMDFVRSAHPESRVVDLYRILSFGVYPIMPAWKGAGLTGSDIYAIAHYVKSLIDMRGTAAALDLKQKMTEQKAFEIPKEEEPKPAATEDPAATEKKDEAKPEDAKKDDAKKDDAKKEPAKDEKKPEQKEEKK